EEHEFCVLLGPSGCGKTTTLRCVAGLEKPDGGTIEIGGQVVNSASKGVFVPPEARNIGMVFQSYAVWPHMTVFQNVAFPLKEGRRRIAKHLVPERVHRVLSLVRLEGLADRPVTDLSGGQQQRVALARAVVTEPEVLLMDEPLSNLDARLRDEMRVELKRLTRELGVTTLYVTHDQIEALTMGDKICVMRDGQILQMGGPEDIYARPRDQFVAEFVGQMNFVYGQVCGSSEAECSLGVIRCALPEGVGHKERVALAIRPEEVELGGESAVAGNVVRGQIVGRSFLGDAVVWEVRTGETTLIAKLPANQRAEIGNTVSLHLPSECWKVFRLRPID
ncbi:MAG: ABC transporter ATP-binding protein, partial [Chloroflexi bacterium]|nr:ABC transporter ATP-binding protein [Chloroflexota bacterium]